MNLEEADQQALTKNEFIIGYRNIGETELFSLCIGQTINENNSKDNKCFNLKPKLEDNRKYQYMIECQFKKDEIELKTIEEIYVKSYNLNNVKSFILKDSLKNPLDYYQSMLDNDKKGFREYVDTMIPEYKQKVKKWISEEETIVKNIKDKSIKKL